MSADGGARDAGARQVLRAQGAVATPLLLAVAGVAWMLVSYMEVPEELRDGWDLTFLVVQIAYFLWIASWARTRVVTDPGGVTVVNPVRRHRVEWDVLVGFGWGSLRRVNALEAGQEPWPQARGPRWATRTGLGFLPKTCLVLADGTVVPMFALGAGGGGVGRSARRGVRALERVLAASRGEPLPPWPLPRRVSSPLTAALLWGGLLAAVAALSVGVAMGEQGTDRLGWVLLAGLTVFAAGVWRLRVRVRADDAGLLVGGWWRSRRLGWAQVGGFEVARRRWPLPGRVVVARRGGRRVPVSALTAWPGLRRPIDRKAAELTEVLDDRPSSQFAIVPPVALSVFGSVPRQRRQSSQRGTDGD